ncbi:hypothetical protein ABHF33_07780 [Chitinibacter sp. FCG-7]|jgi:hypothetical protein|uniref:Uncharacterized protein n=1 Tax=Chitinibacter mangrovi TaxID=3153927 RepID=A0AAU7FE49_9NEIS|nr:hypothetical protein [Chitinibacter sp. GC72]
MAEVKEQNPTKTTPAEAKKQQQKPLAERLAGQKPFEWIKVDSKTEQK